MGWINPFYLIIYTTLPETFEAVSVHILVCSMELERLTMLSF